MSISFKAGRMVREGKMLRADERKGLVTIGEQDDGLLHFRWHSDRTTRTVDEDLILFPGDAKLERVTEAPSGSRVYLLRFEGNAPRTFFWMQEPRDNDEELVKRINSLLGAADDEMQQ